MKRLLNLAVATVISLNSGFVVADDKIKLVAEEAVKGAMQQVARDQILQGINQIVDVQIPLPAGGIPVANAIFVIHGMGKSAEMLVNAKTDKEKIFAGAQWLAGGLTLSPFASVGTVMNVAITVAMIGEAILTAEIHEKITRLRNQMIRDYTVVANVDKSYGLADEAVMATLFEMYLKTTEALTKVDVEMKTNSCTSDPGPQNFGEYRQCIQIIVQQLGLMQETIRLMEKIAYEPLLRINRQEIFKRKNLDPLRFTNHTASLKQDLSVAQAEADKVLKTYVVRLAQFNHGQALAQGLPSPHTRYLQECSFKAANLLRKGAMIAYSVESLPADIQLILGDLRKSFYLREVQDFKNFYPCRDEVDQKNVLYPILIKNLDSLDDLVARIEKNE